MEFFLTGIIFLICLIWNSKTGRKRVKIQNRNSRAFLTNQNRRRNRRVLDTSEIWINRGKSGFGIFEFFENPEIARSGRITYQNEDSDNESDTGTLTPSSDEGTN